MRFSLRIQKALIGAATCVCLAAAVVVVIWAARVPTPVVRVAQPSSAGSSHMTTPATELQPPSRDQFARLCDVPLRRPLYDPPPPKPEVRRPPPFVVELLGTIIEPDNSLAIIRTERGVEYKRAGDQIGPPESPGRIVEIHANAVTVERSEERITVAVRAQEGRR